MIRAVPSVFKKVIRKNQIARHMFFVAVVAGFLALFGVSASAANHPARKKEPTVDCKTCHTCPNPTKTNRCLGCLRPLDTHIEIPLTAEEGPDHVILKTLEDLWEPVNFSHKYHAKMSTFTDGCTRCHHNSPTDHSHPACRECHISTVTAEGGEKPGLKGAYHRQCLGCHIKWTKDTDCQICHASKSEKKVMGKDYVEHHVKVCKEPERVNYQSNLEQGKFITFFHNDHSERFGLECKNCHKNEPCVSCHYQTKREKPLGSVPKEMVKAKCVNCHDTKAEENCLYCHKTAPRKERFNHHNDTGWALSTYHQGADCKKCHTPERRNRRIDPKCIGCHNDWNSENMDHAIVGLKLNEDHIDLDCHDCHPNGEYERDPSCFECHEDELTYPAHRPGTIIR